MRLLPVLLRLALSPIAFSQTYTISTFAGGALPVNIPGTSASLSPASVASDRAGNLFFVDRNTVLRLDATTGMLTRVAGNGTTGFSGDNGPATNAQLYFPTGVAVDSAGNLYIADTDNNRIRKVSNGVITTVAGNGFGGYSGDNGPATNARLADPWSVAVDSAGNLYIADTNNYCIRKVTNGVITTVAGNGLAGFSGDNGPAANAQLNSPYGVAVDSVGNLYIADTVNQRVRKVANGVIGTIAGNGTSGFSGDNGPAIGAQLGTPLGITVDSAGNLYIAERDNNCVRKVASGVITTVAGNGMEGFSGDNGPAISAQLQGPEGVTVDSAGNLYIDDFYNNRIRKITNGAIVTVVGGGTTAGNNGLATSAQLSDPFAVTVDSAGNLYIADEVSSIVWKVSNGTIAAMAGNGTRGFGGDNGPATSAQLSGPLGVAADSAGNVYIADTGNSRVRKVTNGVITTIAGNGAPGFSGDNGPAPGAQLNTPIGLAIDSAGSLYIADNSNQRVRKVANGIITTIAGNGTCCSDGNNNATATGSTLSAPSGVAVDSAGNLYIADDFFDSRVLKVSNGVISVVAGNGSDGFSGDNGPATSAQLWEPVGITLDSAGNLYIADPTNQRIRKVSNGVITTIAGNGAEGFSGDNGPAFNAQLNAPDGIVVDSAGNVYIADGGNGRIRLLTPAGSPSINGGGVVSAASPANHQPVAPGSIASVYGTFLVNSLSTASSSPLPINLGGVSLQLDTGLSAPLFAVAANQVNFQVPWELAGQSQAAISAMVDGQISGTQTLTLTPFAPGIFSMNGQGTGQGAILDTSYRLVDSSNPATAGSSVIQIYCTGLGAVTNQPPSGSPPLSNLVSETTSTPMVTIGGVQTQVLFSGLAPGTVGEYQVDALVPAGSSKGAAVPVVIAFGRSGTSNGVSIGGATSNTVTIAVQ
jgi:trimeric autotransporter adhesin